MTQPIYILGIGGSDHDFGATLLGDGRVVATIESERISRVRHGRTAWYQNPTTDAIVHCLDSQGISLSDVSHFYANLHLEKHARFAASVGAQYIGHHLSHGAATFYTSNFEDATVVVIDGAGHRLSGSTDEVELETVSIGIGKANRLALETFQSGHRNVPTCNWRYMCSNSLGAFYQAVTELIGFGSYGAGKTMGLAPYGDLSLRKDLASHVDISADGRFSFNPYGGLFDWGLRKLAEANNPFMVRARLAAAVQSIYEEGLMRILNNAHSLHPSTRLAFSGGCALNVVANARIRAETPFEEIFIHPSTDDGGTALGAALYGWHQDLNQPRTPTPSHLLGKLAYSPMSFDDDEIELALDDSPLAYRRLTDLDSVAARLAAGAVVGWFRGGAEIGPRALGNRSILASPLLPTMRDRINLTVKLRESFRPLAPAVLQEAVGDYFEFDGSSPFMLEVATVRPQWRQRLSSITHVDGTARLQTVSADSNKELASLLELFERQTGVPILLNTSFNPPGEPIVQTPSHAIDAFLRMNLDLLVIGSFVAEKHSPWVERTVGAA